MAKTPTPALPQTCYFAAASLAAVSACTTRAPIATANLATNNLVQLTDVSSEGLRIDSIAVTGISTSMTAATTAGLVQIWMHNGTFAYLRDEIPVTAVTPSATTPAFVVEKFYPNPILVPAGNKLYTSSTVATTASTNALQTSANGGGF